MEKNTSKNIITEDTVRYVAELARIKLDDAGTAAFRETLSEILDYIEKLREVDTEDVSPTTHVLPAMKNVFRQDVPENSVSPEIALSNAPDKAEGFFKVPRIIND